MKAMTIFFGLSLGVLLGGCCTASEPRVSSQEAETSNVRMEKRVHRYYYAYAGYEKIANADGAAAELVPDVCGYVVHRSIIAL